MSDRTYLERAIRGHGPYLAAVKRLTCSLRYLCYDATGESFDRESVERDMAVIIQHVRTSCGCHECNLSTDLLAIERDCLEAIGRIEGTKHGQLFADLSIQVFIADGRDHESVEDPLAKYVRVLQNKLLSAVRARAAQTVYSHGTRPFMYH